MYIYIYLNIYIYLHEACYLVVDTKIISSKCPKRRVKSLPSGKNSFYLREPGPILWERYHSIV